jgi:hypothetical protein
MAIKSAFKPYTNKSALDNKRGRYYVGGDTDVFANRLGWWERDLTILVHAVDDLQYLITKPVEFKPNLVSFDVYKTTALEWLVLLYNNIVDVNEEFTAGTTIQLPSPARALWQLTVK